jgi:hypothetical protein
MDLVRAIRFPFDEDDWIVKVVVGSLLVTLVPFLGLGYQIAVARNVIQNKRELLPGTSDLGQVITDTIMGAIAWIVYLIPISPLLCIAAAMSAASEDSDVGFMFACMSICVAGLIILYMIPVMGFFWMGMIRYAETGNFSEFVKIRALWRDVRTHLSTLLVLWGYTLVLGLLAFVASPFLLVTCVGIFVLGFWSQVSTGHLVGQAALSMDQG